MEGYDVLIYPTAQDDLRDIMEELYSSSVSQANEFLQQTVEALQNLRAAPEQPPLAKDSQFRLRGYRALRLGGYIAFYSLWGNTIQLRRIVFSRPQYAGVI